MKDGMQDAQMQTEVQGAAVMGVYIHSFLCLSFPLLVFTLVLLLVDLSIFIYIYQ